jgi:hypothetical protein
MIFIHLSKSTDRTFIETTSFAWKNRIERSCGLGEPAVVPGLSPFTSPSPLGNRALEGSTEAGAHIT